MPKDEGKALQTGRCFECHVDAKQGGDGLYCPKCFCSVARDDGESGEPDMEKKPVYSVGVDHAIEGTDYSVKMKLVYCAHIPLPMAFMTNPQTYRCSICGVEWRDGREKPNVVIGFFEAGEDGGK